MPTVIKICGITNKRDLSVVCEEGVDYFGLIFYEKSPRYVGLDLACELVKEASAAQTRAVGVTVNCPPETILHLRDITGITHFQLHGSESPEEVQRLKESGLTIIKAFRVGRWITEPDWRHYDPHLYLCDTLAQGSFGGTGQPWDVDALPQNFPLEKTFVAGGLNPENVTDILDKMRPFGVDVSSGVECSPGVKDHSKIRRFVQLVREHI